MPVYHDREALLAEIRAMPEKTLQDGLLLDCPKRRRREQAANPKAQLRIQWPQEQKIRFATQYNRFVEICTKEIGIELLLRKLEAVTDEELRAAVEGEGA